MRKIIWMIFVMLVVVQLAYALNKPVEGVVILNDEPVGNSKVGVYVEVGDAVCRTVPIVLTDDRGYFITDLANLRNIANDESCENLWKASHNIVVGVNGFYAKKDGVKKFPIEDMSGRAISLRLEPSDDRLPYAENYLKEIKIEDASHDIDWRRYNLKLNFKLRNINGNKVDNVNARVLLKDSEGTIIDTFEEKWMVFDKGESKKVEFVKEISGMWEGLYSYDIIAYSEDDILDNLNNLQINMTKPGPGLFERIRMEMPKPREDLTNTYIMLGMILILFILVNVAIHSHVQTIRQHRKKK